MGKYDSLRKSQAPRHSAHSLTPGLGYVPTVCRSVLNDDGVIDVSESSVKPTFGEEITRTGWDLAMDDLSDDCDDEPLPVPELVEETRVVPRTTAVQPIQAQRPLVMQPIQSRVPMTIQTTPAQKAMDPLAMLAAATIHGSRRNHK